MLSECVWWWMGGCCCECYRECCYVVVRVFYRATREMRPRATTCDHMRPHATTRYLLVFCGRILETTRQRRLTTLVPRYYLPYSGPWPQCTPHWGLFWDRQFLRAKQAKNSISAWFFSDDTFEVCRSCQNSIGIPPAYLPSTRNLLNYISVVLEST